MQNVKLGFNPIQCSSATFETLVPTDGSLYFVTDTGQLFLAKDDTFVEMCGGVNLVYGKKSIEYDNSGQTPDPNVSFTSWELEDSTHLPMVNDLILNTDGCFYRVKSINGDNIETTRLTLQGTGGGSGGGSGGGGGSTGSFSISIGSIQKVFSSTADRLEIPLTTNYDGDKENYISMISFYFAGQEEEPFYTISDQYLTMNTTHQIDLIKYINLFDDKGKKVYISVLDKFGNSRSTYFNIYIVQLALEQKMDPVFISSSEGITYTSNLSGATSGITNKKIIYKIYRESNLNTEILTYEAALANSEKGIIGTLIRDVTNLEDGVYVITVQAQANVVGSTTVIQSNMLTNKFVKYDATLAASPILGVYIPESIEQYTSTALSFLLASSDTKAYTAVIKVSGETKDSIEFTSNQMASYDLYFETLGSYNIEISITELGLSYSQVISITSYTGNLPVIDPSKDSLMLYLTPRGKTNSSLNKDVWDDYNGRYQARLSNFYYGKVNGWLSDSDGTPYLGLSSGAKMNIPSFYPFQVDPTRPSAANQNNPQGLTIEIDFEVDGVTDFSKNLIYYLSRNNKGTIQVGFAITGDKIRLYNSRMNGVTTEDMNSEDNCINPISIVEGKRIRTSFVIEPNRGISGEYPMCLTYLDGIISGAMIYQKTDSFQSSSDDMGELIVDSTYGSIKIYGIRIYQQALSYRNILNNYTATLPTLAERQSRYESNDVFDNNGLIDYSIVSSENYNLQIPYMVLRGGYPTASKDKKWDFPAVMKSPGLPTGKKDYRMVDVEIHYPKNEYFKDYKDYSFVNKFADGVQMPDAAGLSALDKHSCIMYCQGTSSMEYPVKNLRLRQRNKEDYFTVRPDIAPVEIITLKADYMDSSGSHNTGTANLVDDIYANNNVQSPGQKEFGKDTTIVTCIKGFPCLIFYNDMTNNKYKYIGKYNMNLDKSNVEVFGFTHDDTDFGYLPEGYEYYPVGSEEKTTVQPGEKINAIHCYEFLDNTTEVCNFQVKAGLNNYQETWYNDFVNTDNKRAPGWTAGFESRFPEDEVGRHDADSLYPLASWTNELYTLYEKEISEGKKPTDIEYKYTYSKADSYNESTQYYTKNGDSYEEAFPDSDSFATGEYYTRIVSDEKFSMVSLERFKREYQCYLDKNFLLIYYIITDVLLMVDSRVKNMMIATWGPEKRTYVDYLTGETKETNNFIFYPIFYDMDTMLGLDNAGQPRFHYYDEDTNKNIYNGNCSLWTLVRDALPNEIASMYNDMEANGLIAPNILPYYNLNQANMANEAFYNGDAKYKYLDPAINGYDDDLNNQHIDPGVGPYLYAAQGNRSLTREYFINNRVKFRQGHYSSYQFRTGDVIEFRWNAPVDNEETAAKLRASIKAVPPDGVFNFKSLKTGYAGVMLGRNAAGIEKYRFTDEETHQIVVPNAANANGTEAYILGVGTLKDVGDLSNKYIQKFTFKGTDNKLSTLTLGNPHKDYYNPFWSAGGQAPEISLSGCKYLQHFNLQNCSNYNNALNFSNCPIIETILLTGSGVNAITLPVNGVLKELRLPSTIQQLTINSHTYLTADNFSIGDYSYGASNKIGIDGEYVNDYSRLSSVTIIDTPIDTYDLVKNASSLQNYYFKGFTWNINENDTQYCKPVESSPISGKTYYIWSESSNGWAIATSDDLANKWSLIREKVDMLDSNNNIIAIPILEYLKDKTPSNNNYVVKREEALQGTINININGAKANEFDIYQKYHNLYPNVHIVYGSGVTVEKAYTIKFYNVLADDEITDSTETYYEVLTNGKMTLAQLTSASGPAGTELRTPARIATDEITYSFNGSWIKVGSDQSYSVANFDSYVLTTDTSLRPEYVSSPRIYHVYFYDDEGNEIIDNGVEYTWQQRMSDNANTPMWYYKIDKGELDEGKRYEFVGWIGEKDYLNNNPNPSYYDPEEILISFDNLKLYAHFKVVDIKTPTSLKCFNVIQRNVIVTKYKIDTQYPESSVLSDGNYLANDSMRWVINVKSNYKRYLGGKITIPSRYDGHDITVLSDFTNIDNLTHVYFEPTAKYDVIGDEAPGRAFIGFAYCNNLVSVKLPDTVRYIGGTGCFESNINSSSLEEVTLNDNIVSIGTEAFYYANKLKLTALPANLQMIGLAAFAFSSVKISNLPATMTEIFKGAFCGNPDFIMTHFGHIKNAPIDAETNNITKIISDKGSGSYRYSFRGCFKGVTDIYLHDTLEYISPGAFYYILAGTGNSTLTVHSYTDLVNESNYTDYFDSPNIIFTQVNS